MHLLTGFDRRQKANRLVLLSKLVILSFSLLTNLSAQAQEMPKKPKEIAKSDWARFVEKDKYFTYDSAVIFENIGTQWICTEKQYFKYANSHILEEKLTTSKEGDSFIPNTKEVNVYDSLTHSLVDREFYKYERVGSNINTYKDKYGYSYDKQGNLVIETKTTYLNYLGLSVFSWINMSGDSEIYSYNVHGLPIEKKVYEGIRNEVWTLKMRILTDSVDASGLPITIHFSVFLKNGKEIKVRRFSAIKWFSPPRHLDDAQQYLYKDIIGVPRLGAFEDSVVEYTYHNAAGNIDSVVDYPAIGISAPPLSKQVFGYGIHNCRDTMNYIHTNTGKWQLTRGHKEVGSYDANKLTFNVTVSEFKADNTSATKKEIWEVTEKKVYY